MRGKVIAITGGASGIGLATAKLLASMGAKLSISDISRPALASLPLDTHSSNILATPLDVRDPAAVTSWVHATISHFGHLDGAANMAGISGISANMTAPPPTIRDLDLLRDWDPVLGVNLTGTLNCLRAQLNAMTGPGSIVNAASIAGFTNAANVAAYSVSKAGVMSLTKVAAREEGWKGIRVNAVAPGIIMTNMQHDMPDAVKDMMQRTAAASALRRTAVPEEVAKHIVFLLGDESSYTTGQVHIIDGGSITN